MRVLNLYRASVLALSLAFPLAAAIADTPASNAQFGIRTLSTHADRVSGGDVLVKINYKHDNRNHPLEISLNGRDVSATFRPGDEPKHFGRIGERACRWEECAPRARQRLVGNQSAMEILIEFFAAFIGILTDRYRELA